MRACLAPSILGREGQGQRPGGEKEARVNIRSGRSWTFLTAFKLIIIRFMYEKAALAVLWLMDWRGTKQETT